MPSDHSASQTSHDTVSAPAESECPVVQALVRKINVLTDEIAQLALKVDMILNFERLRDVVVSRHPSSPLVVAKNIRMDARDLFEQSDGFHNLEYDEAGNAYRWTGPGHFTRLTFHVDRSAPIEIALRIASFGKARQADPFTLDVDGNVYRLRANVDGNGVELVAGPIPPQATVNGLTEAFLHVPTMFSLFGTDNPDRRSLGIAISAIDIRTLG